MALFPHVFLGTLREHYLLLFTTAGCVALVAGFVGAWVGARFGARAAARRALAEAARGLGGAPELRGLQESMDTLLLEVERVAEAQRFTARLLAERPGGVSSAPPLPRREAGHVTPH